MIRHQVSIFKLFMKDYITLHAGVMTAENYIK